MYRLNISYKQFYIILNEIWLYENDPNDPGTCSEPGGKQWQHNIRGWRNFNCWQFLQCLHKNIFSYWIYLKLLCGPKHNPYPNSSGNIKTKQRQKYRTHDDVIKWTHFPRYWPFCHRSPMNSPHKGQWRGALMFPLICTWINGWVNNREAGDLRRNHVHYDVTVMN